MRTFITVHVVARDSKGKILLLQRSSNRSSPGSWDLVTGYIQERESAEEAAVRELKEETSLVGEVIKTADPIWVDEDDARWVDIAVMVEVGDTTRLKVDANESQSFRWVGINDPIVQSSPGASTSLGNLGL